MIQTVQDLMDLLSEQDPEAEVRLATQPSWPLAFMVSTVRSSEEIADDKDEDSPAPPSAEDEEPEEAPPVVWVVAGDHPDGSPYAPRAVWGCDPW